MEDAMNASLEESEVRFNGIGVDVASGEFLLSVIDNLMSTVEFSSDARVCRPFVCHDARIVVDILSNRALQRLGVNALNRLRVDTTVPLY